MLALTPRGFGHPAMRLPASLTALSGGWDATPRAFSGLAVMRAATSANLFYGSATARSPRVMRTASRPRHPAPHARAESGDVHCSRFARGFTITRGLAASRVPYLRVHFRYGSVICLSALRTPIAGLTLLEATPPKDDRRGPDFNRLAVRTAGRTSAGILPASSAQRNKLP
jgi:hypothetical protein